MSRGKQLPQTLSSLLDAHPVGVSWTTFLRDHFDAFGVESHRQCLPAAVREVLELQKSAITDEQWNSAGAALTAKYSSRASKLKKRKHANVERRPQLDGDGGVGGSGGKRPFTPSSSWRVRHLTDNPAELVGDGWSEADVSALAALANADRADNRITGNKLYWNLGNVDPNQEKEWSQQYRQLHAVANKKHPRTAAERADKLIAQKIIAAVTRFFHWSRSEAAMETFREAGVGVSPEHLKSHGFGFVFDTEANPLGQALHVDGKPTEGQCLLHLRDGQPATKVLRGVVPTLDEFCASAGVTRDQLELLPIAMQWAPHTTWAFEPRAALEARMEPAAECARYGDITVLGGCAPHAGPPTTTPRVMLFCAVGGTQPHDTTFQANPWVVANLARSPNLLRVTADYREHRTSRYFDKGALRSEIEKQEAAYVTADAFHTSPMPEAARRWLEEHAPSGYEES